MFNFMISKKMRYFITTMETCCISTAADKLFITRSPLGKVISELEALLGEQLFIRKKNHLEPTPLAIELYKKIISIYHDLDIIESNFIKGEEGYIPNLIFDENFPKNMLRYVISALKSDEITFTHQVFDNKTSYVHNLLKKKRNLYITLKEERSISASYLQKETIKKKVCLIVPKDYKNNIPAQLPLLLHTNENTKEIRNWLTLHIPYLALCGIQEREDDIVSMLYSVATKKGMMLLPESIFQRLRPEGIERFASPALPLSIHIHYGRTKDSHGLHRNIIHKIENLL